MNDGLTMFGGVDSDADPRAYDDGNGVTIGEHGGVAYDAAHASDREQRLPSSWPPQFPRRPSQADRIEALLVEIRDILARQEAQSFPDRREGR